MLCSTLIYIVMSSYRSYIERQIQVGTFGSGYRKNIIMQLSDLRVQLCRCRKYCSKSMVNIGTYSKPLASASIRHGKRRIAETVQASGKSLKDSGSSSWVAVASNTG